MAKASKIDLESMFGACDTTFLPSGSQALDLVFSNGRGVPLGCFIEISSDAGLGKSTAALHICKYFGKLGKASAYLDFEHGVNVPQLESMGLMDLYRDDIFRWYQPVTYEDGEVIMDQLLEDDSIPLIVIDSVTSMLPEKLQEGSVSDIQPGLQARYASAFLLKYKGQFKKKDKTIIFVNQMRTKFNFRGNSRVEAAGGTAQKFYMDMRFEIGRVAKLEKQTQTLMGKESIPYGADLKIWSIKNRFAKPFVPVPLTVFFGKGISNIAFYVNWLKQGGYITGGGGGWFTIKLGDLEEKARGTEGLYEWTSSNLKVVKDFIESLGGIKME